MKKNISNQPCCGHYFPSDMTLTFSHEIFNFFFLHFVQRCILDIDVQGARSVRASSLEAMFIFICPPSMEELEKRLRDRWVITSCVCLFNSQNPPTMLLSKDIKPQFFSQRDRDRRTGPKAVTKCSGWDWAREVIRHIWSHLI